MNNDSDFSYLDQLNDVQRMAVSTMDGPVMVIAGPGSGKTRVLTYRIAHLLNNGVPPWQILALTFTNKSAKEMKERIEKIVGSGANRVWAGTFHSIFARILRVEAHRIGYPNDFTIYDTDDSKSVIKEIIKTLKLDPKVYNVGAIRARISSAKSNLITPKAYVVNEDLMTSDKMNRRPMTHLIYEKYTHKCLKAGAMDFDDLLLQMFKLLYQNPDEIRLKYQRQFQYLMVDEFQDTNFLQYEILKLLCVYEGSPQNICIVGDDAQSIYSFRGATIENILMFEQDFPKLKTYKLEQNYRSTDHIVAAANEVINYNKNQIQKKIWTENIGGHKIKVIKAVTETDEGKRIADTIVEQKNRFGLANRQIAILYRTNSQSRVFEECFRRSNIAYRIYGGMSFYSRKEIKDLIAYLRLTINPKDNEALKRVINFPRRGIGKTTIDNLIALSNDNDMSIMEVLTQVDFNARSKKSIGAFMQIIQKCAYKTKELNAYDAALFIARTSGLIAHLKADTTIEGINKLENVNSLLDGIKDFVEDDTLEEGEDATVQDRSIAGYLQNISLMTDADQDDGEQDTVTLMSVHAAKGLEYKSVFVVGLEENLFPSYMSMSSPEQIDEERRLFYVAITRAEAHLTLSYANSRYQYGQMRFNDASRFLEEVPESSIDAISSIKRNAGGFSDGGSTSGLGTPKLLGNFKKISRAPKSLAIDPKDFKPSPSDAIKEGMKILHMKFGEGIVQSIDDRSVATIVFDQLSDNSEKRIMLQFAKLQILD
ncbi:UvrD-helicase domain-containing protein [Saprospiraceae bacterium]|jgi:DNA helicase II / ATP-dependent DNA helicase PcrA|nr:UvrD-helicase domain-containing protein [Saprospiraceae bacterium]MDC1508522.1 UvrD-helicase domain-containing protein [Saprospiraceae bacterium]HAV28511.1 ATP-dependent DNA helicase [Saprospirales bacterium]HAW03587.1 ATP-dependent DNA helicase [Saprospirales bacterium]